MKTLFTTAGIHARDRFDCWHDFAGRVLTGHSSQAVHRDRFEAELRAAHLADIGLYDFATEAVNCERNARHISRSETSELFLCRNAAGGFAVAQDGRRDILAPGDMVLLDPNLQYSVHHTDGSRVVMTKIPRRILEARFGSMREFFGVRLPSAQGVNGFLSCTLDTLGSHVEKFDEGALASVRNQLVDLMTHVFGAMRGDGKRVSAPRSLLAMRLRAVIEARLTDHKLDSESAAHAVGISVRYANSLLESEGTSIARLIRELRLERCRQALADPAHDHRTIGEIAFGWGFSDLTHFGRSFSAAFGASPRAFRQNRLLDVVAPPLIVEPPHQS